MGHYKVKARRQKRGTIGRKGLLARYLFEDEGNPISIDFYRKKSTKKYLVVVTDHSLKVIGLQKTEHHY